MTPAPRYVSTTPSEIDAMSAPGPRPSRMKRTRSCIGWLGAAALAGLRGLDPLAVGRVRPLPGAVVGVEARLQGAQPGQPGDRAVVDLRRQEEGRAGERLRRV